MIHARQIRLIDEDKKLLGLVSVPDALAQAQSRGLDLVEIAPQADPPVCRIMDYGKFLYELHKRDHDAKKHQKQIQIKEIKFRPKISIHDYTFKIKHVRRFLEEGNKVKITVLLRGRERSRPELGFQVLQRVLGDAMEFGRQDGTTRKQDWAVSALLVPTKSGGKDAKIKNPPGSPKEVQGHGEQKNNA
ncbi:MAG: translation initiation factor IF-3 [Candidatus Aminicenantes bacterium]|nr:translation initiation factor IF-3 [Candidatus Aminicenantes bacterium]